MSYNKDMLMGRASGWTLALANVLGQANTSEYVIKLVNVCSFPIFLSPHAGWSGSGSPDGEAERGFARSWRRDCEYEQRQCDHGNPDRGWVQRLKRRHLQSDPVLTPNLPTCVARHCFCSRTDTVFSPVAGYDVQEASVALFF